MNFCKVKWVFLFAFAVTFFQCSENRQSAVAPKAFFNLDSLLDSQIETLSGRGYTLRKSVQMDGREEQIMKVPDSAGWAEEFVIIRDFDLNKPNNVGAYTTEHTEENIRYERSADTDAPVKVLEVRRENGNIKGIFSNYYEDKSIYQHRRNLVLEFENGILKNYKVRGFQKMILKDTIRYIISGEVVAQ